MAMWNKLFARMKAFFKLAVLFLSWCSSWECHVRAREWAGEIGERATAEG
jgi:hypothetical protein